MSRVALGTPLTVIILAIEGPSRRKTSLLIGDHEMRGRC
jgi:hypothetical protein